MVEHFLGKEEVPSSSLGNSSGEELSCLDTGQGEYVKRNTNIGKYIVIIKA